MTIRTRIGRLLRKYADRVDPDGAPRMMGASFTFERGRGLVWNEDRRGCPVAYLGVTDYERAHTEALDPAPRVDWKALARGGR